MNHPRPPAHVEPYITALGFELAVKFLLHFGGTELYIPQTPSAKSELVKVLGMEAAQALCDHAQRIILQRRVPNAKPWLAQYFSVVEDMSNTAIARKLHATDVSVRRWLAGKDERPMPDMTQMRQLKLL
ncbi:hypothetical protein [Cypionkella psychrotolerans]|uniref:hypothetical protein n=1 Tax=Cypionkella psychrotolerans TaxID=1678131 RepID=UPI0009EA888D|nr:hypothetical protein [Cypionkella psychrotolerans]